MAATFTEVSLEEMEKCLKRGFRTLRPKKGLHQNREICFDLFLSENVAIRVLTSIGKSSSKGSDVGEDAIRVALWNAKGNHPMIRGKMPIVKRTQGWMGNLRDRIEDFVEMYEEKDDYWEARANPDAARSRDDEKDDRDTDLDDRDPEEKKEEVKAPVLNQPEPTRTRSPSEFRGTFTRLKDGSWGIRIEGAADEGDRIKTERRDGKIQWLVAGEVVWRGRDNMHGGPITVTRIAQTRTASEGAVDYPAD